MLRSAGPRAAGLGPARRARPPLSGLSVAMKYREASVSREGASAERRVIMARSARVERKTKETDIAVEIDLDGAGTASIATPLPFLSHMLEQIARHGLFDLTIRAAGDVEIDGHHTTEDVGIALG